MSSQANYWSTEWLLVVAMKFFEEKKKKLVLSQIDRNDIDLKKTVSLFF